MLSPKEEDKWLVKFPFKYWNIAKITKAFASFAYIIRTLFEPSVSKVRVNIRVAGLDWFSSRLPDDKLHFTYLSAQRPKQGRKLTKSIC